MLTFLPRINSWASPFALCENCKRSLLPDVPQDDGIIIEPWDKEPHTNGCLIRTSFILICIFVFIILLKYL